MIGEAIAYGAATIINAIATGYGGAFGVKLWTRARVVLNNEAGIVKGRILSDTSESTRLIECAVRRVLREFNLLGKYGAYVETDSNIPIARGLKSSSVAANAIVLATLSALGKTLDDLSIVKLGVEASIDAKVTVTGAFDDACASYFGNAVLTDNSKMRIVKNFVLDEDYSVLFLVPREKAYTSEVNVKRLRLIAPQVMVAYNEALKGNIWQALTLNGMIYSSALGHSLEPVLDALELGAIAAGLTGKGPAIVAVVDERGKLEELKERWRDYKGDIIETSVNREKAHIIQ